MSKFVLPVICHTVHEVTVEHARLALEQGADGVFLISHCGRNDELFAPAREIMALFPQKRVGVNLLGMAAHAALEHALEQGMEMLWSDFVDVNSKGAKPGALKVAEMLKNAGPEFQFFGAVASHHRGHDRDPAKAALMAAGLHIIPTTTVETSRSVPVPDKVVSMHNALINLPLAVSYGINEKNVGLYVPYVSHFLVTMGIPSIFHPFNPGKVKAFVDAIRCTTPVQEKVAAEEEAVA